MAEEFSVRVSVKIESLQEELVSIKEEVSVKKEIEWDREDNSALTELYAGHNVTDELVLGPETLQTPDVALATNSLSVTSNKILDTCKHAQHEQLSELKTCVVQLEDDIKKLHKCHLCQKMFKEHRSHNIHMKAHEGKDKHLKIKKTKYADKKDQSSSSYNELSNYFIAETKNNVNKEKNIITNENNYTVSNSTQNDKADFKKNRKSKLILRNETEDHVAEVANEVVLNINNESHEERNFQDNTKKNKKTKLKSKKQTQAAKLGNDYDLNINNQIKDKPSSHEVLTNTCKICNKSFSGKNNLTRHLKLHTGQKPHKCKICMKEFARIDYLRTHERIHSNQKVYSCEYCYKEFTDSSNYNKHIRFHRDVKRFTCEFCGKQFGQAIHLSTHQLTHTGEKPYNCKTCRKQFTYKHRLKAHERLHIGRKPYGCQLCSKRFIAQCRLSRHEMLIHKMILSFNCALCEEQFKKKAEMINHISNSH